MHFVEFKGTFKFIFVNYFSEGNMRTISYIALMAVLPLYNAAAADVSTAGELRTALGNGDDISLSQDIALPAGWVQVQGTGEDMIIDGNGHTVDGGESTANFFDNRGHISSITNITFNGIHNDPASGEDDNMGAPSATSEP